MLIFGFAMVVIMIWKPRGLISTREPTAFLKEKKKISADMVQEGTADGHERSPMTPQGRALLEVEHLTMRFGGLTAVNALSFQAARARSPR
jgi:hypothetical protein